jgi:hypothetical protein
MKGLWRGVVGVLGLVTLSSCSDNGHGCPSIGCGPAMRILLSPPLTSGSFKLTLGAPGDDEYTCSFSPATCSANAKTCPAPLQVRCSNQGIESIESWQPIFSPTVRVEQGGKVIAEETLPTQYEEYDVGCATCRRTEVTLEHL